MVRHVADRIAVMYLGRIVEQGPSHEVLGTPRHPYTAALVSAAPTLAEGGRDERIVLGGEVPSPLSPPSGCTFRTRCWKATERCASDAPELEVLDARLVRCHHPMERTAERTPA